MNRKVQILAWGLAGALLTGALTGAAVAVAGNGIATPVRPFSLTSNRVEQPVQKASEPHMGPSQDQSKGGSSPAGESSGGHGGDSTSSSNSGPGSESSGPGSGDSGGSDEGSGDSGGNQDGGDGDDDD
jgi:hypothetical protein